MILFLKLKISKQCMYVICYTIILCFIFNVLKDDVNVSSNLIVLTNCKCIFLIS